MVKEEFVLDEEGGVKVKVKRSGVLNVPTMKFMMVMLEVYGNLHAYLHSK